MIDCLLAGRRADGSTVHIVPPPPKPAWSSPPVAWRLDFRSICILVLHDAVARIMQLDCGASTALLALVVRQGLIDFFCPLAVCNHHALHVTRCWHDRTAAGQFAVEGRPKMFYRGAIATAVSTMFVSTCNILIQHVIKTKLLGIRSFLRCPWWTARICPALCALVCCFFSVLPLCCLEGGSRDFV